MNNSEFRFTPTCLSFLCQWYWHSIICRETATHARQRAVRKDSAHGVSQLLLIEQ